MHSANAPKGAKAASRSKFVPAIGRHIDDMDVRQITAIDHYRTSRTRDGVTYIVLAGLLAALATSAIYGFQTGSFAPLERVWDIGGPFAGWVIAFYFNRNQRGSG